MYRVKVPEHFTGIAENAWDRDGIKFECVSDDGDYRFDTLGDASHAVAVAQWDVAKMVQGIRIEETA